MTRMPYDYCAIFEIRIELKQSNKYTTELNILLFRLIIYFESRLFYGSVNAVDWKFQCMWKMNSKILTVPAEEERYWKNKTLQDDESICCLEKRHDTAFV